MAVIVLLGPTASGKTGLAMALQDRLGGKDRVQLISVDSAMVYRGMDIGTAKPTEDELKRYPHALINLRDPANPYTAADFVADADQAVRDALAANKHAVLVGGTMLYARSFLQGLADLPEADPNLRAELDQALAEQGAEALHARLQTLDPEAAAGIEPGNHQRLLRALEVITLTNRPISALWQERAGQPADKRLAVTPEVFALMPRNRAWLHARIEQRFDTMLDQGFLDEVTRLHARPDLHADLPAMRAVGYRQAWSHLDGHIDEAQFRADSLTATRRLAKRQLTWLRSWPELNVLDEAETDAQVQQITAAMG